MSTISRWYWNGFDAVQDGQNPSLRSKLAWHIVQVFNLNPAESY